MTNAEKFREIFGFDIKGTCKCTNEKYDLYCKESPKYNLTDCTLWLNEEYKSEEISNGDVLKELERLRKMVNTIYERAAPELPYDKQHTLIALDIAIKSFKEQNNKI